MKQTNNAIKFLMAQYRAIFKNANIAMVAAIAAAALASGQAQAGTVAAQDIDNAKLSSLKGVVTIDGKGQTDDTQPLTYKDFTLTGGATYEGTEALTLKFTGGEGHTIKGIAAGTSPDTTPAKPNVNLGNTALVIETATTAKLTIGEVGNPTNKPAIPGAATNVTLGDITVNKGELDLVAADDNNLATIVNAANVTIGKGKDAAAANEAVVKLAKHSSISASGDLVVNSGAAVTVSGGASLSAANITINEGAVALGEGGAAGTEGNLSTSGKLDIKGGEVSVAATGFAKISASEISLEKALSNSGSLVVDGALTANNEATITNDSTLVINDAFNAESGSTVTNNDGAAKVITFNGQTTFKAGSKISNSGAMVIGGQADFQIADSKLTTDLTVGADNGVLKVVSGGSASMSAATFKTLLTGKIQSDTSTSGTVVIKSSTDPIDLQKDAGILTESGDMSAKLGGAGDLKIKTENAKFVAADAMSGAAANAGVTLAFNKLDLGKNESGFTVKKVNLEIAEDITVKSNKGLTLQNDASLTLNGTGKALELESITLGEKSSAGTLNVDKGNWGVKTLTVTSGTANVNNSGTTLTISTGLKTDSDGKLVINGGTVDAKGVTTLSLGESGASITNAGKLILSADKVVNEDFTLNSGNYAKLAVDGSTDAQISLIDKSGSGSISMTLEQFKQFRTDTGFKGLFDIKLSDKPTTQPQMGLGGDAGVAPGVTNGYENVQGKIESSGVSDNFFIGNAVVQGGDTVNLEAGGALSLSNANANNANGQYVTDKDGGVGKVQFKDDNTLVLGGAGGKIGSVTATNNGSGSVTIDDGANVEVVKDSFGDSTNALGTVNIKDGAQLNVKSGSVFTTNLNVGKGGYVFASGDVVVKKTAIIMGDVDATNLTLSGTDTAGAKVQHAIAGGATIDADKLSLAENNTLTVGKDGADTSSANVFVGTLDLAANSIIVVDPEPYKPAALVVAEDLDGKKNDKDAGTLKGGAYVGMNSALGIGFTEAEFNDVMASYLVDGKFDQNGLKNALVLNKAVTIANGNGIVVNAGLTVADAQTTAPDPDTLVLESGAGLIITDNAFGADKSQAAITFASGSATPNKVDAKVLAVDGAKISLVGDITAKDTGLKIFAAQGTGSTVTASGDLVVEAAGGLLTYTYANGADLSTTGVTLKLDPEVEKQIRSLVSAPVGQLFVDYANGEFSSGSGVGYDFVVNTLTAKKYGAIDAAAHAATYAGAQQAAVAAVTTMADAMFGRVGAVGVEAATISATGSQANGGVWLTPMYKSVDSDGFNAEGVSYGSDVDLAGVAFGTDTVNGNMRFGAVFNIGSGDAEGKGQGNGLKDEFDYYGFGIYSAMGFGNFALVGDASMTVISHEVEGLGLSGKADTKAVTMGLTGQYTISTAAVDVTPHLGARFIRLNTDSYDLMSADGAIATTDFDVQNVFSIPLGVTLSKAFSTSGWTLAPSADLTVAFNTGDTEAKSHTQFNSTKPMAVAMNTEVLDEVQYGVTLGLGAQYGAFGTSFGINYTGSSNTDSFGVNAQCRYMF